MTNLPIPDPRACIHRVSGQTFIVRFDRNRPTLAYGAIARWALDPQMKFQWKDAQLMMETIRLFGPIEIQVMEVLPPPVIQPPPSSDA